MRLQAPNADVLGIFGGGGGSAYPPLPEHLLGELPDLNRAPFNAHPISSGPCVLAEWNRGVVARVRREPPLLARPSQAEIANVEDRAEPRYAVRAAAHARDRPAAERRRRFRRAARRGGGLADRQAPLGELATASDQHEPPGPARRPGAARDRGSHRLGPDERNRLPRTQSARSQRHPARFLGGARRAVLSARSRRTRAACSTPRATRPVPAACARTARRRCASRSPPPTNPVTNRPKCRCSRR